MTTFRAIIVLLANKIAYSLKTTGGMSSSFS